jgi:hypothetical protein
MHFCWTHNITTKIVKMKELGKLFVQEDCSLDPGACGFEATGFSLKGSCHDWDNARQ